MASSRNEKFLALAAMDYADKTTSELESLCRSVLEDGMHGLCFSPYVEGQQPGDLRSVRYLSGGRGQRL